MIEFSGCQIQQYPSKRRSGGHSYPCRQAVAYGVHIMCEDRALPGDAGVGLNVNAQIMMVLMRKFMNRLPYPGSYITWYISITTYCWLAA